MKHNYASIHDNKCTTFNPPYDSPLRKSTWTIATFNLLNTMVGGGTLSIPYVFYKCGWAVGTLLMIIAMIMNNDSLNVLCLLSRTYGCTSYSDVMEKAFGMKGKKISTMLLFFLLVLVIIAFLVLLRDISASVFDYFSPHDHDLSDKQKNMLVTILVFLCYPIMVADQLYNLRLVSYMGTTCVCFLLLILFYKSTVTNFFSNEINTSSSLRVARMGPIDAMDIFTAIPITLISYFCHCNIISVYCELQRPTNERMSRIINYMLVIACTIYILFGLSGYFFAYEFTQDNILDNFPSKDPALVIARIGLGLTLMCQLPMIVVPCRQTFYPLFFAAANKMTRRSHSKNELVVPKSRSGSWSELYDGDDAPPKEHSRESKYDDSGDVYHTNTHTIDHAHREDIESHQIQLCNIEEYSIENNAHEMEGIQKNSLVHSQDEIVTHIPVDEGYAVTITGSTSRYIVTLIIVMTALLISENIPGVSTVWTIAGSSMCITIAFLLPYMALISLWNDSMGSRTYLYFSYFVVIVSMALIFVCTTQALINAVNGKK